MLRKLICLNIKNGARNEFHFDGRDFFENDRNIFEEFHSSKREILPQKIGTIKSLRKMTELANKDSFINILDNLIVYNNEIIGIQGPHDNVQLINFSEIGLSSNTQKKYYLSSDSKIFRQADNLYLGTFLTLAYKRNNSTNLNYSFIIKDIDNGKKIITYLITMNSKKNDELKNMLALLEKKLGKYIPDLPTILEIENINNDVFNKKAILKALYTLIQNINIEEYILEPFTFSKGEFFQQIDKFARIIEESIRKEARDNDKKIPITDFYEKVIAAVFLYKIQGGHIIKKYNNKKKYSEILNNDKLLTEMIIAHVLKVGKKVFFDLMCGLPKKTNPD